MDMNRLAREIRRNCDISDARHAGVFSICGLALRLRDLYRWERGLDPWEEGDPAALLEWIGAREGLWDTLADADYGNLMLAEREFEPFDTEAINARLEPEGMLYGAGYARGLKPTFFLARIERRQQVQGVTLYLLGRELARDLLTLPAMTQGRTILMRQEAARMALWDTIVYAAPSAKRALAVALDACGISDHRPAAIRPHLGRLLGVQEKILIGHELGELKALGFERSAWRQMVAAFSGSRVEILVRRVKDLLADTDPHGTLARICRRRDLAGLALFVALADGLSRAYLPRVFAAFERVREPRGWQLLAAAVADGHRELCRLAEHVTALFREGLAQNDPSAAGERIDRLLGQTVGPLPE
ncbi:MAG: hypothetical protein EHM15_02920 [Desulfobacteraceae bacterium]|nr:MAG: hypothetical protein EHM15_02920 [Desulfobacteraceae bacterium]